MAEQRLIDANSLKEKLNDFEIVGGHKYYRQGMDICLHEYFPVIIDDRPTIDPETLPLVQQLRKELEDTKQKARAACSLCKALAESNRAQTICDQCPLKGV